MFISILYMFRTTSCSSSENHLYQYICYLSLWPSSMQVGKELFLPDLHTRRSPTQSDTYQMYWYNWFSWWRARGCSKHVENWNKHIEKRIVRQVVHLQELLRNNFFFVFYSNINNRNIRRMKTFSFTDILLYWWTMNCEQCLCMHQFRVLLIRVKRSRIVYFLT
jgi:hypothetical protein